MEYDHPFSAGKALAEGEVDGLVFPAPASIALSKQFRTTTVVGQIATHEEYGVVFDEGSPLRQRVNDAPGRDARRRHMAPDHRSLVRRYGRPAPAGLTRSVV
jgi:hypothetical protein